MNSQGWICPKCGNVHAPFVIGCGDCNKSPQKDPNQFVPTDECKSNCEWAKNRDENGWLKYEEQKFNPLLDHSIHCSASGFGICNCEELNNISNDMNRILKIKNSIDKEILCKEMSESAKSVNEKNVGAKND